jgi:hypothetical protein
MNFSLMNGTWLRPGGTTRYMMVYDCVRDLLLFTESVSRDSELGAWALL